MSLAVGQGGKASGLFPRPVSVVRGPKVKGYRLYCLAAISTRKYAPLTVAPAPRDNRDGYDGFSDSRAGIGKIVTAVTVVTRSLIERQSDTSSGVGAGAFIADMILAI